MPRDIEAELRRSLQARATDITPDPALYARVQARIRRDRTFRFAFAGLATAMVIAGVAVAAPRMMDRRIEFEPGGVATQPAPEPTRSGPDPAGGGGPAFVFSSDPRGVGTSLHLSSAEGEVAVLESTMSQVGAVDVRPSTSDDLLHVAATYMRETPGCASVNLRSYAVGDGTASPAPTVPWSEGKCATSPRFSPDGQHVAWAAIDGDWVIEVTDWSPTDSSAEVTSFGLPWPAQQPVDIQDWVWTEGTATTARGYLVVRTMIDGGWQLLRVPIERQADGELGVTLEPQPITGETDASTPVAFASAGDGVSYTMELEFAEDGPARGEVVWRTGDEVDGGFALPPELFSGPGFDVFDLWITASPEAVVFGNAATGQAWWTYFPEQPDGGLERPEPSFPELIDEHVVHADLLTAATVPLDPGETGSDPAVTTTQVDVYFGMTGADACVADQPVTREVVSPGVARGAITELLKGPSSRESNEGVISPFNAVTAGALNDITIVDGQARVDFADFSSKLDNDACTKSAILDSLDKTLLQFPTVKSTRYSFDGDVEAFESWLDSDTEGATPPEAVTDRARAIFLSAEDRDWEQLRLLSENTSCTLSDQPEPCVPYWKDQEQRGEDPLGTLVELLEMPPTKHPDAPMWVWPEEWAAGKGYNGPRIGIDEDGVWRYYVQEGG